MALPKDVNSVSVAGAVSDLDGVTILPWQVDHITGRLKVSSTSSGSGGFSLITVAGTIDDSNVTFTSSTQPVLLNINGAEYQPTGGIVTWTYVAGTITLSTPVGTGGSIFGIAQSNGVGTPVDNEIVSGSGTSFTLASTPISGTQHVFGAGIRLTPGAGNDYTISGATITTVNSYAAGQLLADYFI